MDVCDEIEGGVMFFEVFGKSLKVFDWFYVNMIKVGEVGGLLEVIL